MSDDTLKERVLYKICGIDFFSKTSSSTGYLTRHAKKYKKKMKRENSFKYKLVLILKVTLILNIMILKIFRECHVRFLVKNNLPLGFDSNKSLNEYTTIAYCS
jgi:hypothetical protein